MRQFIIRLADGNYVMHARPTSNYLQYDRTRDRKQADRFNDFDSQVVIKRLKATGERNCAREEITGGKKSGAAGV